MSPLAAHRPSLIPNEIPIGTSRLPRQPATPNPGQRPLLRLNSLDLNLNDAAAVPSPPTMNRNESRRSLLEPLRPGEEVI